MKKDKYKELEDIVYSKNTEEEYSQALHSFYCIRDLSAEANDSYRKPPKTMVVAGNERLSRYYAVYRYIYDSLKVKKYKMSFEWFMKRTEQLFFERAFNKANIESILKQSELKAYTNIFKIYGVKTSKNELSFGDFKLVKKEHIVEYLKKNVKITKENKDQVKALLENKKQESESGECFIYFIHEYSSADSIYSREFTQAYLAETVNIIRYMIGWKGGRTYVDTVSDQAFWQRTDQICANGQVIFKSEIIQKDVALDLSAPYFNDAFEGNAQIWKILCKENRNDLEKRILKAIRWVGISIDEPLDDLACTELAFAFEGLFKQDESTSITPSIQGQIAETLAFICGRNAEERAKIVEEFKLFYRYRSAVAHGSKRSETVSYQKYFMILRLAIKHLLTDDEFKACKTIKDINDIVNTRKYTCEGDKI